MNNKKIKLLTSLSLIGSMTLSPYTTAEYVHAETDAAPSHNSDVAEVDGNSDNSDDSSSQSINPDIEFLESPSLNANNQDNQQEHTYYVCAGGNGNGSTPDDAMSVSKLNSMILSGNCTVCFKRGDVFFDALDYKTDNPSDNGLDGEDKTKVTFTSYGDETQPNPCFSQAKIITNPTLWQETSDGSNIWKINLYTPYGEKHYDGSQANCETYQDVVNSGEHFGVNNIGFIYDPSSKNIYGNKVQNIQDLSHTFDFYNDTNFLYVYSTDNPTSIAQTLYLAANHTMFPIGSNVTIDGVDFKFGGGHAIEGKMYANSQTGQYGSVKVHDVTIQNCNINYIGGALQQKYNEPGPYDRLGNGIEFLPYGSNITIKNNNISNCYDTATTLQGDNGYYNNVEISNNTFTHNSQSFEIWSKLKSPYDTPPYMTNIKFNNNLCIEQGRGWGYDCRPDQERASDIEIQVMADNQWDLNINNNVFYNPRRVYYFDDSNGTYYSNIINFVKTHNNIFYLAEGTPVAYSAFYHSNPVYGNNGQPIYEDNANGDICTAQTFRKFAEDYSRIYDCQYRQSFNGWTDTKTKNQNDTAYKISTATTDNDIILASIEYVGSQGKASFALPDNLPSNDLLNKIYVTSIKYPYSPIEIPSGASDAETEYIRNENNKRELIGEHPWKLLQNSALQLGTSTVQNITTSAQANYSQQLTAETNDYTELTWLKQTTPGGVTYTELASANIDSAQNDDNSLSCSFTPDAATTGSAVYYCIGSKKDNNLRIAQVDVLKEIKFIVNGAPIEEGGSIQDPSTEGSSTQNPPTEGGSTQDPSTESDNTQNPTPDDSNTQDPSTEGDNTQDSPTEGDDTQNPTPEGDNTQDSPTEGSSTQNPPTEGDNTQNPTTDGGSTQDPSTEGDDTQNPTTDGGSTQDPSTESDNTQNPTTDGGNTQDPSTEGGNTQNPTTEGSNTQDHSSESSNTSGEQGNSDSEQQDDTAQNTTTEDSGTSNSGTVNSQSSGSNSHNSSSSSHSKSHSSSRSSSHKSSESTEKTSYLNDGSSLIVINNQNKTAIEPAVITASESDLTDNTIDNIPAAQVVTEKIDSESTISTIDSLKTALPDLSNITKENINKICAVKSISFTGTVLSCSSENNNYICLKIDDAVQNTNDKLSINASDLKSDTVYLYSLDPITKSPVFLQCPKTDSKIIDVIINNNTNGYILSEKPINALTNNSWNKLNDTWCYIKDGHAVTGWICDNSKWYYLDESPTENKGKMKTGWLNNNGNWYYLSSNGSMATGWNKINNTWYYLNNDGSMAYNTTVDGYVLSSDGSWVY